MTTKSKESKGKGKYVLKSGYLVSVGKCDKMSVVNYNAMNEQVKSIFNLIDYDKNFLRIQIDKLIFELNFKTQTIRTKGQRNVKVNGKMLFCIEKYNLLSKRFNKLIKHLKSNDYKASNMKEWVTSNNEPITNNVLDKKVKIRV